MLGAELASISKGSQRLYQWVSYTYRKSKGWQVFARLCYVNISYMKYGVCYEVNIMVYLSDWKAKLNPAGNLSSWTFPLGKTLRGPGVVGTPGRAVVVYPAPDSLKIPAKWPARFPANNSGFWWVGSWGLTKGESNLVSS